MVRLGRPFRLFSPVNVLVIGDFMLDAYTTGTVKRISPEAPVSVLHVDKEESLPGGAGNVALNLMSLGATVAVIGRVGADRAGHELETALSREGINTEGLFTQEGYKTPVKNRLIAGAQQILRVDFENIMPLAVSLEDTITALLPTYLDQVQAIAISDYAKGFLSRSLLRHILDEASARGIPVVVDPKGEDFSKYTGALIVKPNLVEAYTAAKVPLDTPLEKVAQILRETCQIQTLMITRSEAGISLFERGGEAVHFPVHSRQVKDVTGAGDTVLAVISLAVANQLDVRYGVELANIAAALAVERLGCARITLSEIAERLLAMDVENKIFDEEHLFALQQALKGKRYAVLGIDSHQGMTTALFRALRKLSLSDPELKLIAYTRDDCPDEEFVSFLASLEEVDFVVLKNESLKHLCDEIHPHRVFILEGEELHVLDHPAALLYPLRETVLEGVDS